MLSSEVGVPNVVQQDIVPTAKKHTTIWGKKSSPDVKFI
jgi:hypothetical protein